MRENAPEVDQRAEQEATAIADQNLNKYRRDESIRRHLHYASLGIFWVAVGAMLIVGLVWLFHMVTPEAWHFLTEAQKDDLKTILLTAVGSSFVTDRAQRIFSKDDKS